MLSECLLNVAVFSVIMWVYVPEIVYEQVFDFGINNGGKRLSDTIKGSCDMSFGNKRTGT